MLLIILIPRPTYPTYPDLPSILAPYWQSSFTVMKSDVVSDVNKMMSTYYALMAFAIIFSISTFVIAIVLAVQSSYMKRYSIDFYSVFIFFVIGIFVPILTFVAACMTLSKIKWI